MSGGDSVLLVHAFGGGEYEVGVDGICTYWRVQTGLGPVSWKYFESGDGLLEDALSEIITLRQEVDRLKSASREGK